MANEIIFRDCFKIEQPSKEEKASWNDALGDLSTTKRSLFVYMDATHSAIVNLNNRFYLPAKMKEGSGSFLSRNGKAAPILKHHDKSDDPIGKIRSVEYITTIPDEIASRDEVIALTNGDLPLKKQVKAARRFLHNQFANSDEWAGLGFLRIGAEILDPKSIQQVTDGLWDSVSVSFKTDHAFCSICATDWADEDGPCEHIPGKIYEDKDTGTEERALLIPGDMKFSECSLVNFDADPHTVIEIATGNMMDSEEPTCQLFSDDTCYEAKNVSWELTDSERGADMKKINVKDGTPIELNDAEEAIFDLIKKSRPDAEDEVLANYAKKIASLNQDDGTFVDQAESELDDETYLKYALEDLETEGEKINADEVYSDIEKELEDMVKEDLITQEEYEDAKLSTEARKKLKGSTFCGPDRSFPVPDCAHVTAARRLIGRYKGPGNKSAILACVERKAKTLGCNKSDDSITTPLQNEKEPKGLDTLTDKELHEMFHDVEAEMIGRKLTIQRPCSECAANVKKADELQTVNDELQIKLDEANSILNILRQELRDEFINYKTVVDESVIVRNELRKVRADYAATVSVLTGKHENLDDATKALEEAKEFDKEFENIFDSVDLGEVFGKMNNGMVNDDPNGSVDNPVVNTDKDNDQNPEGLTVTEQAIIDRIKEDIEDGEFERARSTYDRMIRKGILRDSITWETISSAKEDTDE